MAHLRAVDKRTRFLDLTQIGQRKGVADYVLDDILDTLGVSCLAPHLIMDTEPRVVPPGEDLFYQGVIKTTFVFQHLQDRSTEEFSKRPNIYPRHQIRISTLVKDLICHQGMDVRMPFGIVAESLDGQGDTRNPQLFAEGDPKKSREARCRALAQLAEQFAIIEKIPANDFRDDEYVLAMRDKEKSVVLQMAAELSHLLTMA